MRETVGIVGLGGMGAPMAANLLRAGFAVRVWNRTPEKARPLVEQGAVLAASPADTAAPDGVVITMLSDDQALDEVTLGDGGLLARLGAGGVHLSMSTVSPRTSRRLAALHQERGSRYLASPVFGKPEVAARAKLWICVSGDGAARARVRPVQEALGQKVYEFGDDPGAANVVKLAGNFLIGAAVEAMAEAFTLAQKNGVGREAVYELFSQTLFDCFVYKGYGKLVATQEYLPIGAKPSLIRKDYGLILQAAADALVPMPLAELIHARLTSTVARGRDDVDWAGFAREVSEQAGL
jgi:3-hydroxyisobutyrate dehydrogenase-like beta-hydroxyacid dehydrogenase